MDKKEAAPPPPKPAGGGSGGQGSRSPAASMSRAEAEKCWEDLIDADKEAAEELFWESLLRDAKAEYAARAAKDEDEEDEEEQDRRSRVFRPWQRPPPGSTMPPPQQQPAVAPEVKPSAVVLGLCAPPHLARSKHERTPASYAPPRPPQGK